MRDCENLEIRKIVILGPTASPSKTVSILQAYTKACVLKHMDIDRDFKCLGLAICLCSPLTRWDVLLGLGREKRWGEE